MMLNELQPGGRATVKALYCDGAMSRRLRELGLIAGTPVTCLGRSPLGDPAAYAIRGAVIALRDAEGRKIEVEG